MSQPLSVPAIAVRTDLRSTNVDGLRREIFEQLDTASASRPAWVEVDLRGARMIDSVGLNLLVDVIRRVLIWGGHTRLLIDDPNLLRTFQFTRLTSHAEVVLQ